MTLNKDLYYGLCTDDFFDSLSFSEILLSLIVYVADEVAMDSFLRRQGFSCNSTEDFMYRMLFFENEDFDLSRERALYVSLLSLKTVGWTEEDLKNHNLSDILYDLCDSFYYPEGSDDMIYFNSFPMRDKRGLRRIRWTPDGSLERYLNEYRYLLNYWDEVILDNYLELFDNKFALIRNGKYKHHLITGKKNSDSDMSLCIWTEKIFVEEKQHEFSFRNNDELKKFLLDNRIVFDSFISNDFFLDEKSYILKYRKKFYENDLDGIGYGSADPFTMGKRDK